MGNILALENSMSKPKIMHMGSLEWILLIILSILWGGSFFFGEVALAGLCPFGTFQGE